MTENGFKAKDIGLRAQKKILSRMANKNMAKVFIDEATSCLLDNIYKLIKLQVCIISFTLYEIDLFIPGAAVLIYKINIFILNSLSLLPDKQQKRRGTYRQKYNKNCDKDCGTQ